MKTSEILNMSLLAVIEATTDPKTDPRLSWICSANEFATMGKKPTKSLFEMTKKELLRAADEAVRFLRNEKKILAGIKVKSVLLGWNKYALTCMDDDDAAAKNVRRIGIGDLLRALQSLGLSQDIIDIIPYANEILAEGTISERADAKVKKFGFGSMTPFGFTNRIEP